MKLKETDRFLLGIVVGVILLVTVAFVLAVWQPKPTYLPDDTPQGVAYDYLFALQQRDYVRAYGYLSPISTNHPSSADVFAEDIQDNLGTLRQDSISIEDTRVTDNRAVVTVCARNFTGAGLFRSEYSHNFEMRLQREQNGWKITSADEYWPRCAYSSGGCK